MNHLCVIVPVFNTPPKHLFESIYNLLHQDCDIPIRIIIVNDGSTDAETCEAMALLGRKKNIEIIAIEHGGRSKASMAGIMAADSEFIARMDSDDVCHSSRLRLQLEYLKANPDTDVIGTQLFMFQDSDIRREPHLVTSIPEIPDFDLCEGWVVNHGTTLIRKSALLEVGGYDCLLERSEDINLWIKMAKAGKIIRNIPDVVYGWRRT